MLLRHAASYIPYRRQGDDFVVFLQRRTKDAPTRPEYLALFGGGFEEGETKEQALYREVMEELAIVPIAPKFFGKFTHTVIKHVFIEEVGAVFESRIHVLEGDYGRFCTEAEIIAEPKINPHNVEILKKIFVHLRAAKK